MRLCCLRPDRARRGFTLIEALVTLALVVMILTVLAEGVSAVQHAWSAAAQNPFGDAASAFETVTQTLSAATLETYDDYAGANGAFRTSASANFVPDHLARRSDLAFVCGPASSLLAGSGRTTVATGIFFAAPAGRTQLYAQDGLDRLLNAEGYFVDFSGDTNGPGFFTGPAVQRWRLKEVAEPSEALQIFASTSSAPWVAQLTAGSAAPAILAENVIALVVLPERAASDDGTPLAPAFAYDSRDAGNAVTLAQLPPRVRVVLAAIDEASAQVIAVRYGALPPPLVAPTLFQDATKLDDDVAALDASLTAAKIGHRIFQREVNLAAAAWSNAP
jgi:uncharacterized protein (TIGR02599 family)